MRGGGKGCHVLHACLRSPRHTPCVAALPGILTTEKIKHDSAAAAAAAAAASGVTFMHPTFPSMNLNSSASPSLLHLCARTPLAYINRQLRECSGDQFKVGVVQRHRPSKRTHSLGRPTDGSQ